MTLAELVRQCDAIEAAGEAVNGTWLAGQVRELGAGLVEALAPWCASCHHPLGYHVSDAGHPSGDMAPWCYCPSRALRALLAAEGVPA